MVVVTAEKFIQNFRDNFTLPDIISPWQQRNKTSYYNTKVNGIHLLKRRAEKKNRTGELEQKREDRSFVYLVMLTK